MKPQRELETQIANGGGAPWEKDLYVTEGAKDKETFGDAVIACGTG
jgi:hypothetical protein